jgi:biopolymer transport protein TolR
MGMATSTQGSHNSINDINVTPMIDVLLVLLIIFMITQPLSRMVLKVQVPPPPQPTASPPTQSNQIVLEMPDNGSYAINGQPVPKDQLDAQLHAIYDPRPAKLLFVKPGQNRVFQDVIDAMDVARGAGVQVIGFTPKEADVAATMAPAGG